MAAVEGRIFGMCGELERQTHLAIATATKLHCPPSELDVLLGTLQEMCQVITGLQKACELLAAQTQRASEFAARSVATLRVRHVIDPTAAQPLDMILSAAEEDNVRLLGALLDADGDVNACNNRGDSILAIAVARGAVENVVALLGRGADLERRNHDHMSPLDVAVTLDPKMATLLIQAKANVDAVSPDGATALFRAVLARSAEAATILLNHGANANATDEQGWTPLWCAALQTKSTEMVSLLTSYGADVHSINRAGVALVHAVVAAGLGTLFDRLVDLGADPNMRTHAVLSPLRTAIQRNNWEMTALVLWRGGRVNDKDRDGRSALHDASLAGGDPRIVRCLLQNSADVNAVDASNRTALHYACMSDFDEISALLLEHGAQMDIRDMDGNCALHVAVMCRGVNVLEVLHEHGVNLEAPCTRAVSPLFAAIESKHYAAADVLLSAGASVHKRSAHGTTVLQAAVATKHTTTVRTILYQGADINDVDDEGRTAMRVAVEHTAVDVAEALANARADLDITDTAGRTALAYACMERNRIMTRLLLKFSANVDLPDKDGWSPLFHAVERNEQKIATILLANGATVDAVDNAGRTPLRIAVAENNAAMAAILVENGAAVNAVDQENRTALFWAVAHDSMSGIEMALGGAPNVHVCSSDSGGNTPSSSKRNHCSSPLAIKAKSGETYNSVGSVLVLKNGGLGSSSSNNGEGALVAGDDDDSGSGGGEEGNNNSRKDLPDGVLMTTTRDAVGVLVALGADIDQMNDWGQTALHFAVRSGNCSTAQSLVNHGASMSHRDVYDRDALCIAVSKKNEEMVQLLVSLGCRVDTRNKRGQSVLFDAVEGGDLSIVRALVGHGAPLSAADEEGQSVVHWCVQKGSDRMLATLLEIGADPNAQNNVGETPLMMCVASDNVIAMRRLLKHSKTRLGLRDAHFRDVFWHAVIAKRPDLADLLADHGADIATLNADGVTPMEWAITSTCAPIVRMLRARGVKPDEKTMAQMTAQMATHLGLL